MAFIVKVLLSTYYLRYTINCTIIWLIFVADIMQALIG